MANNFSFSTQGATPNVQKPLSAGKLNLTGATPASRALNTTYNAPKAPAIPAAAPAPTNQPIKKQTVTTASGDTHTTEYHPPTATFPGMINSLADTSQQGSPTTPQATGGLLKTAETNPGNNGPAYDDYQHSVNELADLKSKHAEFAAGIGGQAGTPFAIRAGEQAQLEQQFQAQLDAAQQKVNEKQQAIQNQITGTQTQQTGLNEAGTLGNATQQTKQSGLIGAAGLAAPQLGSIGQVPFSPTTLEQGDVLGTKQPGGIEAAGNLLGQFQGAQTAGAAGGNVSAQNTIKQGTAGTNSWNDIYGKANDQYATYSAQQSAINGVANQVLELMSQKDAQGNLIINPTSSQFANMKLNQLQTQFSSPQYAAFNTAIQSLQARIGQALQAGEIPTAATGNAQKIADGSLNLGALASTLQQVDKEMSTFVSTQKALADYAKGQLGTTSGGGGQGSSPAQGNSLFHW